MCATIGDHTVARVLSRSAALVVPKPVPAAAASSYPRPECPMRLRMARTVTGRGHGSQRLADTPCTGATHCDSAIGKRQAASARQTIQAFSTSAKLELAEKACRIVLRLPLPLPSR